MASNKKEENGSPEISPYVVTFLLFFFGIWCFKDGWLTTDMEMLKHQLFNRIMSIVLLLWSVYDFFKVKRVYRNHSNAKCMKKS